MKKFKVSEKRLTKIYSPFWKEFGDKRFSEAASLFAGRLRVNDFDVGWFKDKVCLEAGCGSGRYVKAMLDLGAKEVVGIDLDITVAQKFIKSEKVILMKRDIREIPFEDDYFDFVCCNGVLHHTENPLEIIKELDRVLKKNGYLFLYVYDHYTQDWEVIDSFREVAQKFPLERVSALFKEHLALPPNKMFNFMDMLYVPIQRKFTKEELNRMLENYKIKYLTVPFVDYDKSDENRLIAKKLK